MMVLIDSRVVEFYDIYWHIKFWQELMIIGGKIVIGLMGGGTLNVFILILVTNFWFMFKTCPLCLHAFVKACAHA